MQLGPIRSFGGRRASKWLSFLALSIFGIDSLYGSAIWWDGLPVWYPPLGWSSIARGWDGLPVCHFQRMGRPLCMASSIDVVASVQCHLLLGWPGVAGPIVMPPIDGLASLYDDIYWLVGPGVMPPINGIALSLGSAVTRSPDSWRESLDAICVLEPCWWFV